MISLFQTARQEEGEASERIHRAGLPAADRIHRLLHRSGRKQRGFRARAVRPENEARYRRQR